MIITYGTVQLSVFILLMTLSDSIGFQYPENGPACIIVNMDARLQLTQEGDAPAQANSSLSEAVVNRGICATEGLNTATLYLDTNGTLPVSITFTFSKAADNTVFMDILVKFIPDSSFKNNDTALKVTTEDGKTRLSNDMSSFNCTEERTISFAPVNSSMFTYVFGMTVSNVVIQAFNVKDGNLSEAEYCQAQQTTTSIPTSEEQTTQPNEPTGNTSMTTIETISTETATTDATSSGTVIPTTPPITPAPGEPPVQLYAVQGENGTCILMNGGIQFTITYNATNERKIMIIGIPPINQVTFDGICKNPDANDTSQNIQIKFYDGWDVKIKFSKYQDQSIEKYFLSEIDLTANLSTQLFPDIDSPVIQNVARTYSEKTVSASIQGSYKCTEKVAFNLNQDFQMDTFNLQFAAFQKNITNFKNTDLSECTNDVTTNSDIPVIVGASLGGLVVIVLVAYLIGRRCNTRNGYNTI